MSKQRRDSKINKTNKSHLRNTLVSSNNARSPKSDLTSVIAKEANSCSRATKELIDMFHNPYDSKISTIPYYCQGYTRVNDFEFANAPYSYASGETWSFKSNYVFDVTDQTTNTDPRIVLIPAHGSLGYNNAIHIFTNAAGVTGSFPVLSSLTGVNIQLLTPRTIPPGAAVNGREEYNSICLALKVKLRANNLPVTAKKGTIHVLTEGMGYYPDNLNNMRIRPRCKIIDANVFADDGYEVYVAGSGFSDQTQNSSVYSANRTISVPYTMLAFDQVAASETASFTLTIEACGVILGPTVPSKHHFHVDNDVWQCAVSCFKRAYVEGGLVERGKRKYKTIKEYAEKHELKGTSGSLFKMALSSGKHIINYLANGGMKDVIEALGAFM